jgi:hypothetical protein
MKDRAFEAQHERSLRLAAEQAARLVPLIPDAPGEGERMLLLTAIAEATEAAHFSAVTLRNYQRTMAAREAANALRQRAGG